MSSKQIAETKKGNSKDAIFEEIAMKLSEAISSFKESLGEKKFEKRIRKAAKLLGEGIKPNGQVKASAGNNPISKSTVKKVKRPSARKTPAKTVSVK